MKYHFVNSAPRHQVLCLKKTMKLRLILHGISCRSLQHCCITCCCDFERTPTLSNLRSDLWPISQQWLSLPSKCVYYALDHQHRTWERIYFWWNPWLLGLRTSILNASCISPHVRWGVTHWAANDMGSSRASKPVTLETLVHITLMKTWSESVTMYVHGDWSRPASTTDG